MYVDPSYNSRFIQVNIIHTSMDINIFIYVLINIIFVTFYDITRNAICKFYDAYFIISAGNILSGR